MPEFLPSEYDDAVFPEHSQNIKNNIDFKLMGFTNPNMKDAFEIEEPGMTKKDWDEVRKAKKDADDEYNLDADAEMIAQRRGLVVVYPKSNQLQIDIDSEEAFIEFKKRFEKLFDIKYTEVYFDIIKTQCFPSASGLPNRHIYITFERDTFTEEGRIMYQSILGSDPIRELLNLKRIFIGIKNPSRLFEKPEVAAQLK